MGSGRQQGLPIIEYRRAAHLLSATPLAVPGIPSAETLAGYEKLGIVGILLLVLIIGLVVIIWAVRQLRSVSREFLGFVTEQTRTLTELRDAHEKQQETQERLHERLDTLLSCTRSGCPVFEMRKRQHRDAARAAENRLPDQPPPNAKPATP